MHWAMGVELTVPMDKIPMTPEGHLSLKEELRKLTDVERLKISREIGVAREHGDLRENAEYHAAKDKQGMIEARVAEIEDKLSRAEVIDTTALTGEVVRFGAYVKLEDTIRGFKEIVEGKHDEIPEQDFYLVGTIEDVLEKFRKRQAA